MVEIIARGQKRKCVMVRVVFERPNVDGPGTKTMTRTFDPNDIDVHGSTIKGVKVKIVSVNLITVEREYSKQPQSTEIANYIVFRQQLKHAFRHSLFKEILFGHIDDFVDKLEFDLLLAKRKLTHTPARFKWDAFVHYVKRDIYASNEPYLKLCGLEKEVWVANVIENKRKP